jgi:hypothetical protein
MLKPVTDETTTERGLDEMVTNFKHLKCLFWAYYLLENYKNPADCSLPSVLLLYKGFFAIVNTILLHSVFFIILVQESSRGVVGILEKYGFMYFIAIIDVSICCIV